MNRPERYVKFFRIRCQILTNFRKIVRIGSREYELMTEAHATLSVVRNCSKSYLCVCLGEGKQLAGGGWSAVAGEGGGRQYTGKQNLEQFSTTES
jgi:hypothetical protein